MDVPLIFRLQECIKLVHSHCESDVPCLKEILRVFGVVFENLALANFMAVVPPSLREFGNDSVPVGIKLFADQLVRYSIGRGGR
jgi:hypothetical protein